MNKIKLALVSINQVGQWKIHQGLINVLWQGGHYLFTLLVLILLLTSECTTSQTCSRSFLEFSFRWPYSVPASNEADSCVILVHIFLLLTICDWPSKPAALLAHDEWDQWRIDMASVITAFIKISKRIPIFHGVHYEKANLVCRYLQIFCVFSSSFSFFFFSGFTALFKLSHILQMCPFFLCATVSLHLR